MEISKISFSDKLLCNSVRRSSCMPNIFMSMDSCQTQRYIPIDSSSINDNLNEALEILSHIHTILAKDFLSYLKMRIYGMSSSFTQSDIFLFDHSQSSYTIYHIQTIPYMTKL